MSERAQRGTRSTKRWSKADGRAAVSAWRASGLSLAEFARQQGFDDQRLRWWRDLLEGRPRATPSVKRTATLVPVKVVGLGARPAQGTVRILVDDVAIEVSDCTSVSPAWIAALVKSVGPAAR